MRFLVDAQLPPGLAQYLEKYGYPAEHINRVGLGGKSDTEIWHYAARIGAVLITKDEDFIVLAKRPTDGPQVVWVRLGNISNVGLWRAIEPLLDEIIQALNAGEKIVEVV